jgi:hypothetical protein
MLDEDVDFGADNGFPSPLKETEDGANEEQGGGANISSPAGTYMQLLDENARNSDACNSLSWPVQRRLIVVLNIILILAPFLCRFR